MDEGNAVTRTGQMQGGRDIQKAASGRAGQLRHEQYGTKSGAPHIFGRQDLLCG